MYLYTFEQRREPSEHGLGQNPRSISWPRTGSLSSCWWNSHLRNVLHVLYAHSCQIACDATSLLEHEGKTRCISMRLD